MKLPRSITLLGRKVKIVEKTDLELDGDECDGLFDANGPTVFIDITLEPDKKFKILCHECAHAYLSFLGMDQTLNKREVETVCNTVAMLVEDIVRGLYKKR